MDNVFVHELQLPSKVKGLTIPDENGDFTIIINENLCPSSKRQTLIHELIHIKHDHFYKDSLVSIQEIDANAKESLSVVSAQFQCIQIK